MNTPPRQKLHARELRRAMTPTEKRLWSLLRGKRFIGIKFRRQQPLGPYIVDFYCHTAKVILELDGESHIGKEAYDDRRCAWLKSQGYKIVRVWDTQIYSNVDGVLQLIYNACESPIPPGTAPRPTRKRQEK
jgi:very-short-patch-repair endonuclease